MKRQGTFGFNPVGGGANNFIKPKEEVKAPTNLFA